MSAQEVRILWPVVRVLLSCGALKWSIYSIFRNRCSQNAEIPGVTVSYTNKKVCFLRQIPLCIACCRQHFFAFRNFEGSHWDVKQATSRGRSGKKDATRMHSKSYCSISCAGCTKVPRSCSRSHPCFSIFLHVITLTG